MLTVGVTAVGGGVGQSVLRALRHSNLQVRTVGLDVRPMSAGLYWADAAYLVPPASAKEKYLGALRTLCHREAVDVLIPGSDPELEPLALGQAQLSDVGCTVIVAGREAIRLCRDKRRLSHFCRERGLPFVATYSVADAQERIDEISFPIIAKPACGSGSVGVRLLYGPNDLRGMSLRAGLVIQPYLPPRAQDSAQPPASRTGGRLDQSNELSLQYYVGSSGEVLGRFGSVNRLKDGVPIEVVPDASLPALADGLRLVEALAAVGLRGPVNLQGRLTSEGILFFEVNVRYTGLTATRAALGYREVDAGIQDFFLNNEEAARHCLDYQPGFAVIRHVEDTIVPKQCIEAVVSQMRGPAPAASEIPARVLVTGASGYIGVRLIARLLEMPEIQEVRAGVRGHAMAARLKALFENTPRLAPMIGELPYSPWDVEGVETIIHLAACRPSESSSPANAFFLVNAEGTRRLIETMQDVHATRLIYVSSQSIYGRQRPPPWSEMMPARPETPYGFSKWIGEQLCIHQASVQSVVLRSARAYGLGHRMRWDELPHKFARQVGNRKVLTVHGDGQQRIDLVHIEDLCTAIIRACLLPLSQNQSAVFNVGSGRPVSVLQLANVCQAAASELGLPRPVIQHLSVANVDNRNFGMDIRRARARLGWAAAVDLQDGVRELVIAAQEESLAFRLEAQL